MGGTNGLMTKNTTNFGANLLPANCYTLRTPMTTAGMGRETLNTRQNPDRFHLRTSSLSVSPRKSLYLGQKKSHCKGISVIPQNPPHLPKAFETFEARRRRSQSPAITEAPARLTLANNQIIII